MAGTVVVDTVKSSTTGAPTFQNTSGTEIGQLCRAWVSFNGSGSSYSVRGSFNISSVTRTGTGSFTVVMTNALADANYSVLMGSPNYTGFGNGLWNLVSPTPTSTTFYILYTGNSFTTPTDPNLPSSIAVFR